MSSRSGSFHGSRALGAGRVGCVEWARWAGLMAAVRADIGCYRLHSTRSALRTGRVAERYEPKTSTRSGLVLAHLIWIGSPSAFLRGSG
jgi:hypothetical protein